VRQQASTQTAVDIARSSRIDGPFIFESPHRLLYIHYARTCAFPCACELCRFLKMVAARACTRIEAIRGGPEWCWCRERWQQAGARSRKGEVEEGIPQRMVPLAPSGRGGGKRKEEDTQARGGPAAAWRLICSYDLLARVQAAHRSKARQQTLRRAPERRSILTHPHESRPWETRYR